MKQNKPDLPEQKCLNILSAIARGKMAKLVDSSLEVNEFKLQLRYKVHFRTNIQRKGMNPLIPRLWSK